MTFGYNSQLAFSRSTAGINNFANDLLNRLRTMRVAPEVGRFCCALWSSLLTQDLTLGTKAAVSVCSP